MVRESDIHIPGSPIEVAQEKMEWTGSRDLASFEQLVRQYQPYAFSLAMRFLADEAESLDIVQESFIRVWKHLDQYDPKRKFSTWLYRIVTNLCLDRLRSLRRKKALFFSSDRDPGLEQIQENTDWENVRTNEQLAEIIKNLAGLLSQKQRLVFTLRDLQDLTVEEVAEITGMSVGSVKTNLHYARRAIRNVLVRRYGIVRGEP